MIKKNKVPFSCPEGMQIPWYKGLIYNECPLEWSQRDHEECVACPLKMTRVSEDILVKIEAKRIKKELAKENKMKNIKVRVIKSSTGAASVEIDDVNVNMNEKSK